MTITYPNIFKFRNPAILLMALGTNGKRRYFISNLARKINSTYSHTTKLVKALEGIGLIKTERSGRKKFIQLTEKGQRISNLLINMKFLLDNLPKPL